MKKKFLIIDGNSLVNRAFFGIRSLTTKDGIPTNGVYGFLSMMTGILDEIQPDYFAVTFDLKGPTFRHKMFDDYKGTRKGMPDDLRTQMPILKDILRAMNIGICEMQGFEADDVIGTMTKLASDEGMHSYVLTGDKDALQLSSDDTTVLITKKGISDMGYYTPELVMKDFGIKPLQIIDYKGLCGDTSDNIPGVPGIGDKSATKLLQQFESLEDVLNNLDAIEKKRWRTLIEENQEIAILSKRLATIIRDIPLDVDFNDYSKEKINYEDAIDLLKKYELTNIIGRLAHQEEAKEMDLNYEEVSVASMAMKLTSVPSFAVKIFYDKANYRHDKAYGIAVISGDDIMLSRLESVDELLPLKSIFEDPAIAKYGYDIKQEMIALRECGIYMKNIAFDGLISAYLLDANASKYELSTLSYSYCQLHLKTKEELLGKGKKAISYDQLEKEDFFNYMASYVKIIDCLRVEMEPKLEKADVVSLMNDMELPLVEVLADMEFEGFTIKADELETLDTELTQLISGLTESIHALAGREFNIASPKQLGVVLFEELGLTPLKKTKTGYSTNHDSLMKIINDHEIVQMVLDYRTYTKLKSTYIDGLFAVINEKTNKIHSSMNQTVAATGRLSSTDPNLQNIPMRLAYGRQIRKAFIASDNCTLVDADYSQIELRVLAAMSKDPGFVDAFNNERDIHSVTASQVFHVDESDVTKLQRSHAKEVNFGIVYGMSDFGLSESLGISRKEAKEYIERYFTSYPNVQSFMDGIIEKCKEDGFVTTLFHRRRYVPDINNKNFMIRSGAERMARNTPIQGSAADIIKLAMIDVYKTLNERGLKSKLILQVHDELIIDTHIDELEEVKVLLKECMESVVDIGVKLSADMEVGDSWYDAK